LSILDILEVVIAMTSPCKFVRRPELSLHEISEDFVELAYSEVEEKFRRRRSLTLWRWLGE
jgi:hypothetical protein